nr:hypothetical protein [uncultured Methanolobus sp.]
MSRKGKSASIREITSSIEDVSSISEESAAAMQEQNCGIRYVSTM